MHRSVALLGLTAGLSAAAPAAVGLEELPAETARDVVAQSQGVVVVDLFSRW